MGFSDSWDMHNWSEIPLLVYITRFCLKLMIYNVHITITVYFWDYECDFSKFPHCLEKENVEKISVKIFLELVSISVLPRERQ